MARTLLFCLVLLVASTAHADYPRIPWPSTEFTEYHNGTYRYHRVKLKATYDFDTTIDPNNGASVEIPQTVDAFIDINGVRLDLPDRTGGIIITEKTYSDYGFDWDTAANLIWKDMAAGGSGMDVTLGIDFGDGPITASQHFPPIYANDPYLGTFGLTISKFFLGEFSASGGTGIFFTSPEPGSCGLMLIGLVGGCFHRFRARPAPRRLPRSRSMRPTTRAK